MRIKISLFIQLRRIGLRLNQDAVTEYIYAYNSICTILPIALNRKR